MKEFPLSSEIEELKDKTFKSVYKGKDPIDENDAIFFIGEKDCYILGHEQDCCEEIHIEDIGQVK